MRWRVRSTAKGGRAGFGGGGWPGGDCGAKRGSAGKLLPGCSCWRAKERPSQGWLVARLQGSHGLVVERSREWRFRRAPDWMAE